MTPMIILAASLGGVLGLAADRLAARWPVRTEGGSTAALDWRTFCTVLAGAASLGALTSRWPEPQHLAVLAVYLAALIVLLGTDLRHRLLPDVITLPLVPYALALLLLDLDPLLTGTPSSLLVGLASGVGAPLLLLVTDRLFRGGLGMGDVKLAVSLGLVCGASRLLMGFLVASLAASLLILALMAAGRLGRRTAIPFGPILIGAGVVAMLLG